MACPFCTIANEDCSDRIIRSSNLAIAIEDGFPVSKGHTLIIPRRHIASFFDTTDAERNALMELLNRAKILLDTKYKPDGYNVGINDGPVAGQTINHMHIHLIPRYTGDMTDPRGGVRWIMPDKADYWS
jgi:diadenosine tetraphosphate (Ap4A) HIT family hydrolase